MTEEYTAVYVTGLYTHNKIFRVERRKKTRKSKVLLFALSLLTTVIIAKRTLKYEQFRINKSKKGE